MRRLGLLGCLAAASVAAGCGASPEGAGSPALPLPADEVRFGVFEGRVPAVAPHEKAKVALTLLKDPATATPTEAWLQWIPVPPDAVVRHVWKGTWRVERGTPHDPQATVYVLPSAPADLAAFQAVGPDVLLVLDSERRPRVGNAAWSWTLSRTH